MPKAGEETYCNNPKCKIRPDPLGDNILKSLKALKQPSFEAFSFAKEDVCAKKMCPLLPAQKGEVARWAQASNKLRRPSQRTCFPACNSVSPWSKSLKTLLFLSLNAAYVKHTI